MIRTIIVDDEILSRIGIKSLIHGKEDIYVTGVFASAQEALDHLSSEPTDIVITDIEMAGLDGLDLITRIREEELAEGVIIVSCHSDFSYASEAIARGTDAYLLKATLEEKQLISEIKRVFAKRRTDRMAGLVHLYKDVPAGTKDECYYVAVLHFIENIGRGDSHAKKQEPMFSELLEEIVRRYQMGTFFTPRRGDRFLILAYDKEMPELERIRSLRRNLRILEKNIAQYTEEKLIIGVSSLFDGLEQVQERYEEACLAAVHEPEKTRSELFAAYSFMETHPEQMITLEEMAKLCSMSVPTFCRKLKEETGRTMTRYLNELRVEKVKERLEKGETLSSIAEQTGFSNENYLSRVFKAITGMTISEYRETIL